MVIMVIIMERAMITMTDETVAITITIMDLNSASGRLSTYKSKTI